MTSLIAKRSSPVRDDISPLQKLVMARSSMKNWVYLGLISRLSRLTSRSRVSNTVAAKINNRTLTARTRTGCEIHARWADLGAIYDVFVVNDYDFTDINWTKVTTIVDIGANIGAFSLWAAQMGTPRVFAVEPGNGNYEILAANMRRLGGDARTLKAAVAAQRGTVPFYDAFHGTNSSIIPWRTGWDNRLATYPVDAVTLEDVIDQSGFDRIDLLKIDIEGAEDEIFASLDLRVLDHVGFVIIECHPQLGTNVERVISTLTEAGMTVAREDRASPMVVAWR